MADPLDTYRKPGFPKESVDEATYKAELEYVGLITALKANIPQLGKPWGDYDGKVSLVSLEPSENKLYGTLTCTVERKFSMGDIGGGAGGTGTLEDTNEEIDWVASDRSLYEHAAFSMREGTPGKYVLTEKDRNDIKAWQAETNAALKTDYQYVELSREGMVGNLITLSPHAKKLAQGINQGIERWTDHVPVLRRTSTYKNGPGPNSDVGKKSNPVGFVGMGPPGYEWIKTADRCVRRGGQNTWVRDEEWTGVAKVWVDKNDVYW